MNSNNRGQASFFKILLRDSIDRLPLPPAFARKYFETGSLNKQIIVLKIKSSDKWSVTYSKFKDKYYFMDGWLKFMKDNGVHMGDFLVFWLLSPSPTPVFQVSVYGPNGCLKQPTITTDDAVVKEETSDDDSFETVQQKMTRVVTKSYMCKMLMKNGFIEATGLMNGYRSVRLRNRKGKTWDVKLVTYASGRNQITRLAGGWYGFRKDNQIKIGDTCEFYHVKSNLLYVRVLTAEEGNMSGSN